MSNIRTSTDRTSLLRFEILLVAGMDPSTDGSKAIALSPSHGLSRQITGGIPKIRIAEDRREHQLSRGIDINLPPQYEKVPLCTNHKLKAIDMSIVSRSSFWDNYASL